MLESKAAIARASNESFVQHRRVDCLIDSNNYCCNRFCDINIISRQLSQQAELIIPAMLKNGFGFLPGTVLTLRPGVLVRCKNRLQAVFWQTLRADRRGCPISAHNEKKRRSGLSKQTLSCPSERFSSWRCSYDGILARH